MLADPYGSGVLSYLETGEFKSEGSSITEGIGIMRLTANFKKAKVDRSLRISDQEMIDMLYHVRDYDSLTVGTSAALNLMACYKIAMELRGSGKTFVTMLCDHGDRYRSKIFSEDWLRDKKLLPKKLFSE